MKQTPLMKLIEWIQSEQFNMNEGYIIRDIDLHAKATELIAEEREVIERGYKDGYVEALVANEEIKGLEPMSASDYFTQTYGGGDE